MRGMDGRAAGIIEWREAITTLPDHHFFELLRMYLGEIKTPYNKQKLIEELSAFLRKSETQASIIKLLSESDVLVISAICHIRKPTQEQLSRFFSDTFTYVDLFERLMNLEERLVVYRTQSDGETVFALNPLLRPSMEALVPVTRLFSAVSGISGEHASVMNDAPAGAELTPLFLASVFSFLSLEDDLYKADGTFKKRALTLIQDCFLFTRSEGGLVFFSAVLTAFQNLSLVHQDESSLIRLDLDRWKSFAALDERSQYAYLTVASCGRFTRDVLQRLARLVADTVYSAPRARTRQELMRCLFLHNERQEFSAAKKSRFAAIVQRSLSAASGAEEEKSALDERELVEKILLFGLVKPSSSGFLPCPAFARKSGEADLPPPVVSIDSGFSVTVQPGASFGAFMPILYFLRIVQYDTVARFEIDRRSCSAAFAAGYDSRRIAGLLSEFSRHPLAQNLSFLLDEWYGQYTAATLYKGYVLTLAKEKQALVEKNENFAPYVLQKLNDGVYVLDFESDSEAIAVCRSCGLDFMGGVKTRVRERSVPSFLPITVSSLAESGETPEGGDENPIGSSGDPLTEFRAAPAFPAPAVLPGTEAERSLFLSGLHKALDKKGFTKEETESLHSRIERKIVISEDQLRPESVRFEKIEAVGMDFLGKIHVIEHAIASGSLVELVYEETQGKTPVKRVLLGIPLSLEKRTGDTMVRIALEPEKTIETLSVGKAGMVKRIRGPIFKERIT